MSWRQDQKVACSLLSTKKENQQLGKYYNKRTKHKRIDIHLYLFCNQSCEHIRASTIFVISLLRCSLSTLPLVLNADSDATVVMGIA
jgi:hypothetical protein